MADSAILPGARAALTSSGDTTSREFYTFFQSLSLVSSLPTEVGDLTIRVDDLTTRVDALEHGGASGVTRVQGLQSIASVGTDIVQLTLQNDQQSVDPIYYYGTDAAGAKGWQLLFDAFADTANIAATDTLGIVSFDLTDLADSGAGTLQAITRDAKGRITGTRDATITGTAGRVTVANGNAAAGVPTIDLATVADGGGGALLRFVRDAWGRLSGTSAASTSDLAEGSNLYFTAARVLATVLTGLSTATSAVITATDTVLSGVGKLQAQITALTASLTGYVPTSRTISTTSPLTGGGDLSANRTITIPSATTSVSGYLTSTDWTTFNAKEPPITSGTTAQYWRGDKTWRDFATDVRAAVLTGLSTATSAFIAATDTVLQALGKLQAQITDNLLPPGYIDGLQMQWVSSTAITVTSGAAYIEGGAKVLRATAGIAKTGLSLAASTWYHVYLYDNAGTPDVELSTAAPASPYNGTARSKSGDSSRRYVGSIRTDAGGNIFYFIMLDKTIQYVQETIVSGTGNVLSNGNSTSRVVVSLSAWVPETARSASLTFINTTSSTYLSIDLQNTGFTGQQALFQVSPNGRIFNYSCPMYLQTVSYFFVSSPPSGGAYINVSGYIFDR